MIHWILNLHGFLADSITQWVDSFDLWLFVKYNISSVDNITDSAMYYEFLKEFTNDTAYPINKQWQSLIVYDNAQNPSTIVATKVKSKHLSI